MSGIFCFMADSPNFPPKGFHIERAKDTPYGPMDILAANEGRKLEADWALEEAPDQEKSLEPYGPEPETLEVHSSVPSAGLLFSKLLKVEAGEDTKRQATIESLTANLTQALEAAGAKLNPRNGRVFQSSPEVFSHGEVSFRLSEDEAKLVREIIEPVMSNPESSVAKGAFARIDDQLNPKE